MKLHFWSTLLSISSVVLASDVISASSFSTCNSSSSSITVSEFNFEFDKDSSEISFSVAGYATETTNVTAVVNITAYGINVLSESFDPCSYNIDVLCPVTAGSFSAGGNVTVPADIIAEIPSVVFSIPDLDAVVILNLYSSTGANLACLEADVSNGKTASSSSASYATVGIAAGALVVSGAASITAALSGLGSIGGVGSSATSGLSGSHVSAAHTSPNAGDVMQWFQAIALNGALSVNYPSVYRSFTKNFAWSTGLISWSTMQESIDTFRSKTGGNLTKSSYSQLTNANLVYSSGSSISKRGLLALRDVSVNSSSSSNTTSTASSKVETTVAGLEAFADELKVPSANTFVTMLLIFLIVIASMVVICLLVKVILEVWAIMGRFPKKLQGFRNNYWHIMTGMIIRTILIVYGTWSLFCLYQFKNGDSWAASLLAGLSLGIFTCILLFFTFQIVRIAIGSKHLGGGITELYDHKPNLKKYGIFYDQFKSRFWWFFIPTIIYSFVKAVFIALGDGHGLVQTIGQMSCEVLMLILLFWDRPYHGRQANVVNVLISAVRMLSLICTLIFVEGLNITETTRTVTGVVLIVIQTLVTVTLAILILINGLAPLFRKKKVQKKAISQEPEEEEDSMVMEPYPMEKDELIHPSSASYYSNESHDYEDDATKLGLSSKTGGYKRTPTTAYDPTYGDHLQAKRV